MSAPKTFRSIIVFRIKPGMGAEFESAFEDSGMLTRPRAIEGFVAAELVRGIDDPTLYYVLGTWTSRAAYAAWQETAQAGAPRAALKRMSAALEDVRPGALFEIAAQ